MLVINPAFLIKPIRDDPVVWAVTAPFLVEQLFGVSEPGVVVDGGVEVDVAARVPVFLARTVALCWAESRPWIRHPPPSGIRPIFLTSRWTRLKHQGCGSRSR